MEEDKQQLSNLPDLEVLKERLEQQEAAKLKAEVINFRITILLSHSSS